MYVTLFFLTTGLGIRGLTNTPTRGEPKPSSQFKFKRGKVTSF